MQTLPKRLSSKPKNYWELQFILYCKGHFKDFEGEMLNDLRHLHSQRVLCTGITNKQVVDYLLTCILQPYILPHLPSHALTEIVEDISPEFVWRTGYPNSLPYEYYSAVIYKLVSLIRVAEAAWFPPELRDMEPDTELFLSSTRPT